MLRGLRLRLGGLAMLELQNLRVSPCLCELRDEDAHKCRTVVRTYVLTHTNTHLCIDYPTDACVSVQQEGADSKW